MTLSVPDPQPPAVPANVVMPPLPALLAGAPPTLAGDQMREMANVLLGTAAYLDWVAANIKAARCNVCMQVFDARVIDQHKRDDHTNKERVLAWIGVRP